MRNNEKGGGPGRPASFFSPLGESSQSDGGRLAGRVLACLYIPAARKKFRQNPKKVTRITGKSGVRRLGALIYVPPLTTQPR